MRRTTRRNSFIRPAMAFLCLIALCAYPGCARQRKQVKRDRPLIGFSMDNLVVERWSRDRDIFISTASRMGADVLLQVAEENAAAQEAQVLYLADKDVDCLVIVASDPISLTKAVSLAKKKGIPVLCYDRLIKNANADLYLSFDYVKAGAMQAQAVIDKIGEGSIAIINGTLNDPTSEMMHEGMMSVISPVLREGKIRLVEDYWPSAMRSEEAFSFTERIIDSGKSLDGIIAFNDMFAEAAIKALAVRRLAGKVVVAGADADLAACQRIAEGTQYMTVYKPIEEIATKAAELAIFLAKSERVTVHKAIWDGSYRIPFYMLEPLFVSRENLKSRVIKDGFHLEEDVYRNVLE